MKSIVDFLGEKLAEEINKEPMHTKGLLRLTIKDIITDKKPEELNYKEIIKILEEGLPNRLSKINVSSAEKITKEMIKFVNKNQSAITMLSI
ncbi:MAG: hypothetical protein EAX96_04170 [Candidatus Lokiarchaeota archaeon]|nr:hypothetical protein [Candidatus Lokiarchaeota archaeon]